MAILSPDKTVTTTNGLKIKQKIIPDSLRATKNVASWCKKVGKIYKCIRDDSNGQGTILQYVPSQLVGIYFEEATKS